MSKVICASAIDGAVSFVTRAEEAVDRAVSEKGESGAVAFPDTAYFLPVIYSFTGIKVQTLADCKKVLKRAKALLPERPSEETWLPYLGNALDAGAAALFACEIIEACKYIIGPDPVDGIWLGAANDNIMRERGIEFVDGTAPGFAAVTGVAPTNEIAVKIARELQEKNIYVFMGGSINGRQFADQLHEEGVQLGWDTRLVPFGRDVSALIYALGFASRSALSFGGVKGGDFRANLKYNKNRVFAFVLALGEVDSEKYAAAAGAINYGFPVIADTDIPQILPTGVCTYEHVVSEVPPEQMVEKALEIRGCKIQIAEVPVPVSYGPAFEGERIRKHDVHAEFGGNKTSAFEFVTSVELDDIQDGEIEVLGPDIDDIEEGSVLPLGIWVEVAGRKMQPDYEPILERQIHHFLNGAEGIWHMGQRDIVWTRVSKDGFKNGLRLEHYGKIIHSKLLSEYPAIVDKVKVTLITEKKETETRLAIARKVYDERNRRLEEMTDESVETFYSCLLCQSFAPDHVCVITPERLGLCGAYNWLDGKAAYEIDETGPNQPVRKGTCVDPEKGVWEGINDYVYTNSHKAVERIACYSIMDNPMTSCGCFEVICAYVPELNGIMAVNREFTGNTPAGMTFSTLAGNVGGGMQTPGFLGCGKMYLTSRKFISAEGGHKRLVWMPKELKEMLGEDLKQRFSEQGEPDLLERIADETISSEPGEIRTFLEEKGHPALSMEDMHKYAESEKQAETPVEASSSQKTPEEKEETEETEAVSPVTAEQAAEYKSKIRKALQEEMRSELRKEIASELASALKDKFPDVLRELSTAAGEKTGRLPEGEKEKTRATGPKAVERLSAVETFEISKEAHEQQIWTVTLGATKENGGTRGHTVTVGGETCMPFHLWEGTMPNPPVVAMEVFDTVSEKYPSVLRTFYGDICEQPAEMAKLCVEKYGADLVSVRLEGTHPEKGGRSAQQAVDTVKSVLEAVEVPLIITGHSHFDSINEVMKAVAKECAGENLLLNWGEEDNYKTIAGAALGYGHSVVSQSPIDVNIAKQMNILLTSMSVKPEQIVMDPMTGALGYGLEYTYSVMERIRLTALGGDRMLAGPMIVSPGQECARAKEMKAPEEDFPAWGSLEARGPLWEMSTAASMLYSGADILIMYHGDAVKSVKRTISQLMDE